MRQSSLCLSIWGGLTIKQTHIFRGQNLNADNNKKKKDIKVKTNKKYF